MSDLKTNEKLLDPVRMRDGLCVATEERGLIGKKHRE